MNISNFIETYKVSNEICNDLINYFNDNIEYKTIGEIGKGVDKNVKDSLDVHFFNQSTNKKINNFFKTLSKYVVKYITKYEINGLIKTHMVNNIQYYKPGKGYPTLHYERSTTSPKRILAYMLYLNTVTDKGGTEFPFQKKTLSANKGDLIIWPAEFTHPHKGIISPTQEKYIATGWFELI